MEALDIVSVRFRRSTLSGEKERPSLDGEESVLVLLDKEPLNVSFLIESVNIILLEVVVARCLPL